MPFPTATASVPGEVLQHGCPDQAAIGNSWEDLELHGSLSVSPGHTALPALLPPPQPAPAGCIQFTVQSSPLLISYTHPAGGSSQPLPVSRCYKKVSSDCQAFITAVLWNLSSFPVYQGSSPKMLKISCWRLSSSFKVNNSAWKQDAAQMPSCVWPSCGRGPLLYNAPRREFPSPSPHRFLDGQKSSYSDTSQPAEPRWVWLLSKILVLKYRIEQGEQRETGASKGLCL